MEGRRLILNDGTEIENGSAGYAAGSLWCRLPGYTMQQAAVVFFNPDITAVILFQYGEMEDRYEGFTNCEAIMTEADGKVSVCMTKGGD